MNHTLTCSVGEPLAYTADHSKAKLLGQTTMNVKCGLISQVYHQLLPSPSYTILSLKHAFNKLFSLPSTFKVLEIQSQWRPGFWPQEA